MTPNPKLRKASAEERIMATAAGLFATFGYNGVSTRDIASGAGVNEVTIYRHHPRKRDLYMAVLEAELQQVILRGDLLARVAEASDGKMALARTFELIAATLTHRPELLRLIQFSALELGEDINPLLRRHLGEFVEVIARYLEPWSGNGEPRGTNAKAVVLALISIVANYGSLHRVFLNGRSGPEEVFSAYTGFCNILMDRAGSFCNTQVTPAEGLTTE
jgi:AcrR family transcriptional regulator